MTAGPVTGPPAPTPITGHHAKARRLISAGRLHITDVTPDRAHAICTGDTGTWHVTWTRHTGWRCSCPAYGTKCSHIAALHLVTAASKETP